MAQLDTLDIVVLVGVLIASVAYFTKGTYWGKTEDPFAKYQLNSDKNRALGKTRNIVEKMADTGKNCVVFYGSQTGTAEDYAARLAKEGKSRYGLETMVADLEDYDFETLDTLPDDKVAMFVVATYGEGEPTDNAVDFYQFINSDPPEFSLGQDPPLQNLTFVAFGLGNNTYEHYNSMVRNLTSTLEKLGAHKVGAAGEGDDGAGTMEEDFIAWKDPMWAALAEKMNLEEREAVYEPVFSIKEAENLTNDSPDVYLGEPNRLHLQGQAKGPFNSHNPFIAPVIASRELFTNTDRNCLHLEIDLSDSGLSYQTGDHVAVWPTNSSQEVDRFLKITGLYSKRNTVVHVKPLDSTAKIQFPTPTTYDAIARYYMEINAAVSRQFVASLAPFAPTESAKMEMIKLGNNKDYFQSKVGSQYLNVAQVLENVSTGVEWKSIPFSIIIEGMNKIQPRYYSISSSSLAEEKKISITATVESKSIPGRSDTLKGVTTNYLLALKQKQNEEQDSALNGLLYNIDGPRKRYEGIRLPIHLRHSNFKLPSDPSKPIIMVGPGTGVAPFRAFVQERATQAESGTKIGRMILFFGCRKESEDFLYKEEWKAHQKSLGDNFMLVTSFSRDGPKKIYVQDKMQEYSKEINDLITKKAYFYVCGDAANMAKAVLNALTRVISEQRSIPESNAEEIVKRMRNSSQYQEDVWS
ncbi:putative NADPH-cytochrome P450 reductase [Blumeria hordei DH14]|uniref:NADPH--cytochrome P450 reductase n=1 Tax=Blumeria graminis f. sp. hordei (strain DH14) TaxID=546991 RepID=N1JBN9_BLUG1|nr:putative NADPH-cytochrome P450 reductase [Blumeria hordei DH14]